MVSFLVGAAFVLMVLSPCLVAQCDGVFPVKLKWRRKHAVETAGPVALGDTPAHHGSATR